MGQLKSLKEKLKQVLPEIIYPNQSAYVKNQFINGRLTSDAIEICDVLDIPGYLVATDIEKAFDSLDHDFLLYFFKQILVWVKISFVG